VAIRSCLTHPLRTALSALAISVAVATVAVVLTGLEGFGRFASVVGERTFGSNTFVLVQLVAGQLSRKELAAKLERNPPIRRSDVRFLDRYSNDEVIYAPVAQTRADVVAGSKKFEGAAVNGSGAAMFRIRDLGIERGRFFLPQEDVAGSQVAVLGSDVAEALFPTGDPLGSTIRLGGRGFKVIGLQSKQGSTGGVSLDRYVWIPIRAFERVYGEQGSLQVFARAENSADTSTAEDRARATMRARRQIRPGSDDSFDILSPEASRTFVLQLAERIGVAAGPISFMALLAAVVVVTNTILVSVAERTREIGIRRAVGASRFRIISEVLTESTLIALGGGGIGLLAAKIVLDLGGGVLDFDLPLTDATVLWSMGASGLSGILAGLYPAHRAAMIDVISALRVE